MPGLRRGRRGVMPQNIKTARIKFEKTGPAVYISHLDLVRLFSRSLARAKIEVAHSEGFNPRPKIVFAGAIPLGIESLCEFADIKTPETQIWKTPETLSGFFPQGINIREIYEPAADFKNIAATKFQIFIKPDKAGASEFSEFNEFKALFSGDMPAANKKGTVINLKDYILDMNIAENSGGYILINAVVKTSPEAYLSPETIIGFVKEKYTIRDNFVKKVETYDKNGSIFI